MPKPKPKLGTWRKRGRTRMAGARTASGRHIPDPVVENGRDDKGHPTTLARRQWLAQRWIEHTDPKTGRTTSEIIMGDVTLTYYPLGVLLTNGTVDRALHDAGVRYARLYCAVAGRVSPPAVVLDDDRAGRAPDDTEEREKQRIRDGAALKSAAAELGAAGRHVKDVVDNVAVYGRTPRWMLPVRPRAGDIRDADALIEGLECLARVFGYRRDRRAA